MEKRILTIIFLVPLFLCWHWFEPAAKRNQKGIKAYEEQKYEDALNSFLSAKGLRPLPDEEIPGSTRRIFQNRS